MTVSIPLLLRITVTFPFLQHCFSDKSMLNLLRGYPATLNTKGNTIARISIMIMTADILCLDFLL